MDQRKKHKPVPETHQDAGPLIQAICLIPEPPMCTGEEAGDKAGLKSRDARLYGLLADRFEQPYVITISHGLAPFRGPWDHSDRVWFDLSAEERNVWLLKVKDQLLLLKPEVNNVICLLGGPQLQALRRIDVPFMVPMGGMSQRMRRTWMEERLREDNRTIWGRLFGRVDEEKAATSHTTNGVLAHAE